MIKVWVLVFYMSTGYQSGGPAVIDNIASADECQRVAKIMNEWKSPYAIVRCIEVWKVKP